MSAYSRIQWLHKKIASGCYPNSSHTVEKFAISQRQAQRDIEMLKNDFKAPIKYSPERRGYFYTQSFELPVNDIANNAEYVDIVSNAEESFKDSTDELQLRLPYSAQLKIKDKLTVMNLRRFIVSKELRDVYNFEFYNIESFLGLLFVSNADITVIKPEWLREKMVTAAKRIIASKDKMVERRRPLL